MNSSHSTKQNKSNSQPSLQAGKYIIVAAAILTVVSAVALVLAYYLSISSPQISANKPEVVQTNKGKVEIDLAKIIPPQGVELPIVWGDLGRQLVEKGVIDYEKISALYQRRGGLSAEEEKLLLSDNTGKLTITPQNASFILNLAWALGLANKNPILTEGPMVDKRYGGADKFASTGGWILADGNVMDHYSKYELVKLTEEQQALVERVAKNIYRPCCGNSTYFSDCNHGMAMLGLLQLMAAQGVSENEMYKYALSINSYWFPSTYATIAKFFKQQGIEWKDVNPRQVLSVDYSSAMGYSQVVKKVAPVNVDTGGSCSV